MNTLKGKKILLGISGSIAVQKVPVLIKLLKKNGAEIELVATENALKLIDKKEIEKVLGKKVWVGMFEKRTKNLELRTEKESFKFPHIDLAKWADIVLLAPASANLIGKMANGLADDLLSTLMLVYEGEIFIAPAMNTRMWNNFFVQENLRKLVVSGQWSVVSILEPCEGRLACGEEGVGKMMEPEEIIKNLEIESPQPPFVKGEPALSGKIILITAGPTREYIDPVRFITNASSGKMGIALAEEMLRMGGKVILVMGAIGDWRLAIRPDELFGRVSQNLRIINVETTQEMFEAVQENIDKADIFISAAAVCDFRPEKISVSKLKKVDSGQARMTFDLEMTETVDILKWVGKYKERIENRELRIEKKQKNSVLSSQFSALKVVGFALETENLIENAKKKLKEKNLDLIIANGPSNIGSDSGEFYFIDKKAKTVLKKGRKQEIAREVLFKIKDL